MENTFILKDVFLYMTNKYLNFNDILKLQELNKYYKSFIRNTRWTESIEVSIKYSTMMNLSNDNIYKIYSYLLQNFYFCNYSFKNFYVLHNDLIQLIISNINKLKIIDLRYVEVVDSLFVSLLDQLKKSNINVKVFPKSMISDSDITIYINSQRKLMIEYINMSNDEFRKKYISYIKDYLYTLKSENVKTRKDIMSIYRSSSMSILSYFLTLIGWIPLDPLYYDNNDPEYDNFINTKMYFDDDHINLALERFLISDNRDWYYCLAEYLISDEDKEYFST